MDKYIFSNSSKASYGSNDLTVSFNSTNGKNMGMSNNLYLLPTFVTANWILSIRSRLSVENVQSELWTNRLFS